MGIIKKIFLIVFIGIVLLFISLSFYIHHNGKVWIEEKLSDALQKEVHVGKTRLVFPLGLRFESVEIIDALTAKVLRINFGVPFFFGDHFNIAKLKLTEPVFFVTYSHDKKIVWGRPAELAVTDNVFAPQGQQPLAQKKIKRTAQGIMIDYFEIIDGRINIFDQPHQVSVEIGKINLKALDVSLPPKNVKTKFDFSAVVLSENAPFAGERVEARGVANFAALNMDAAAKITDTNGNSTFSAHFKSIKNEMVVKGTINVGRFVSGINTKGPGKSSFEGFLANALESSGVEIGVNFTCQTKMNDFNCSDKMGMSGNIVQNRKKPDNFPVEAK